MSPLGRFGLAWGLGGTALLLLEGVVRLASQVRALVSGPPLSTFEWVALLGWCGVMAIAEGYRGFQRHFVPRVVARAWWLGLSPTSRLNLALAPLLCMGLLHATPRRLVSAWGLLVGIIALVVGVKLLPAPWRGIVDAGVVVGLSWGLVALVVEVVRARRQGPPKVALDLPADLR
jgi:hypothetical protein